MSWLKPRPTQQRQLRPPKKAGGRYKVKPTSKAARFDKTEPAATNSKTKSKSKATSRATEPAGRRRYEIDFNGAEILGCLRPGLLSGLRSLVLLGRRGALGGFADLSGALPALLVWMA